VHVVARAADTEHLEDLGRLGVYEAVQPELEAGLELGRQALSHLGAEVGEIQRISDRTRRELYSPFADGSGNKELLLRLRNTMRVIETEWVRLTEDSAMLGKTIGELEIRSETGTSVVAIIRGDDLLANPEPEVALQTGDLISILGTPDQRAAFKELAHQS
jgi:CPA2 family monovalent cation:H+ antiporter-2